jgi:hypothetical protein
MPASARSCLAASVWFLAWLHRNAEFANQTPYHTRSELCPLLQSACMTTSHAWWQGHDLRQGTRRSAATRHLAHQGEPCAKAAGVFAQNPLLAFLEPRIVLPFRTHQREKLALQRRTRDNARIAFYSQCMYDESMHVLAPLCGRALAFRSVAHFTLPNGH